MSINGWSQADKPQPVDDYINTGKTIVLARCLSVEPIMRSGDTHVNVQILHVLKGRETKRELTVITTFQNMDAGAVYLLRTENEKKADENYFRIKSIDSMVQLSSYEEIEELKKLPVKTVVERVMSSRKLNLENQIRRLSDELKCLEQITKEQ
jgi:hypothetical protein